MRCPFLAIVVFSAWQLGALADPPVTSGPQPGEKLTPFTIRGVFGDAAETNIEIAPDDHRGPIVLVFVHQVTRPAIATVRLVDRFAATRADTKLQAATVFLSDEPDDTLKWLAKAESALPKFSALGISPAGALGPSSYKLNRQAALTVIVANDQRVHANFVLTQPNVPEDVPKIMRAIADVTGGGEVPTVEELASMDLDDGDEPNLRTLLQPLLQKDATEQDVLRAAEQVEQQMAESRTLQRRIGEACQTMVRSGKLDRYGTPAAQHFIRAWAEKYGPPEVN